MDYRPDATESLSQMPAGDQPLRRRCPPQLADRVSFACRLRDILAVRKRYGIATGVQLDVPQVSNKAMLVMVHQLSDAEQVTVLNFSATRDLRQRASPSTWCPAACWSTCSTDEEVGEVDDLHSFGITLGPHEGRSLLVLCPGDHPVDPPHRTVLPTERPGLTFALGCGAEPPGRRGPSRRGLPTTSGLCVDPFLGAGLFLVLGTHVSRPPRSRAGSTSRRPATSPRATTPRRC